jgi:hypothetical protein
LLAWQAAVICTEREKLQLKVTVFVMRASGRIIQGYYGGCSKLWSWRSL